MEPPTADLPPSELQHAWAEVEREHRSGDPTRLRRSQRRWAPKFFAHYLERPDSQTGRHALEAAFHMWGDIGAVADIQEAIGRLDVATDVWETVLTAARAAHERTDRMADYRRLLEHLEPRLSDPRGRSWTLLELGEFHLREGDRDLALPYFEQVQEETAHPFHVSRARGYLHEMMRLNPGQEAPDFAVETLDGRRIRLGTYRRRVVLLHFWSTDCSPCRPEIAELGSIRRTHLREDLTVIGVAKDRDREALATFLAAEEVEWPQVWEPLRRMEGHPVLGPVSTLYNAYSIPRTFLIDRVGRITHKDLRGEQLRWAVTRVVRDDAEST